MFYKQSEATAARRKFLFVCVDDVDGKSPKTGLVFAAGELQIIKAGGIFTNMTNIGAAVLERGSGLYEGEFTTPELDTSGAVGLKIAKATVRTTIMIVGQVVAFDPHDATRLGLAALPNAAAQASGGLFTMGIGAGQINQAANGMIDVNAIRHLGTAYVAPTTAGVPRVDVKAVEAAAVTQIVAGVWNALLATYALADTFGAKIGSLVAAPTASAIRDTILDTTLDTGRTIRGWFRRKYAWDFGRVTGLLGDVVTAFKADGVTAEFAVARDRLGGTRQSAGSE